MNRSTNFNYFQIKQEIKEEPEDDYEQEIVVPPLKSPAKVVTKTRIFPMVNLSSSAYKNAQKPTPLEEKWPSKASSSKTFDYDEEYEPIVDLRYNKRSTGQLLRVCRACGEKRKHEGRGLCSTCYQREVIYPRMKGSILLSNNEKSRQKKCVACGKLRILKARRMCMKCYNRVIVNPEYRKENGMGPLKKYQPVTLPTSMLIKPEDSNKPASFILRSSPTISVFEKLRQFRLSQHSKKRKALFEDEYIKPEPLSDHE